MFSLELGMTSYPPHYLFCVQIFSVGTGLRITMLTTILLSNTDSLTSLLRFSVSDADGGSLGLSHSGLLLGVSESGAAAEFLLLVVNDASVL